MSVMEALVVTPGWVAEAPLVTIWGWHSDCLTRVRSPINLLVTLCLLFRKSNAWGRCCRRLASCTRHGPHYVVMQAAVGLV